MAGERIAFFGGTFDPPHRGHIAIAREAAESFGIDRVLFAPSGRQPLKLDQRVTSYETRVELTRLACLEDPRFELSLLDAPRADGLPNFTVDVLRALRETEPAATIFNLAGADSFRDLGRWREPDRLIEFAEWIVVARPGYELDGPVGYPLTQAQRTRIHLLDAVHLDIAATDLRERLAEGQPCDDLLTAPVAAYIREHGLYRHETAPNAGVSLVSAPTTR